MNQRETFAQIAHFFEQLQPESVVQLKNFYSPTARFKDPFNQVQGIEAIEQVFLHMYESLENPRFVITAQVVDGPLAFLN
jgi:ketosteroid isomerase-like protein